MNFTEFPRHTAIVNTWRPRFLSDPFGLEFVERAGTTYDAEGRALGEFERLQRQPASREC